MVSITDQNDNESKYLSNLRRGLNSIDNFLNSKQINEHRACQLYEEITEQYTLISTTDSFSRFLEETSNQDFAIKKSSLPRSVFEQLALKFDSDRKSENSKDNCTIDQMEDNYGKSKIHSSKKKSFFDSFSKKNASNKDEEGSEEEDFGGDFKKKTNYMKKMYRQAAYQSFKKFKSCKRDASSSDESEKDVREHKMFTTAKKQLISDGKNNSELNKAVNNKSLGARRGPGSKFVPPTFSKDSNIENVVTSRNNILKPSNLKIANKDVNENNESPADQKLKNIEPRIVELIMSEIMDRGLKINWDDIAGLEFVKKTVKEIVVWPMLRPDIFTGLRRPPKGLLLFGPPGTGKTLIGKCIASQSNSTFFSISASSLTSKWVGEGEKMVRALFTIARLNEPAVIFIDEIDSLLSQRCDSEHESSRRIKTEFLVQLDGTFSGDAEKLLVVGATNRPHDLDEAARRRFVKRLYIPLPETTARQQIIQHLLKDQRYSLQPNEMAQICEFTEGYSGADVANLCREAALGPIRRLNFSEIQDISSDQVSDIMFDDFANGLKQVRASCSPSELKYFIEWNQKFGSCDLA